jgi:glycosyltransferase involved in cell wall biosynthesis
MEQTQLALSVVMLTLNEEKAIAKVVADIQGVCPAAEILVVDSSTDRTAQIAESMGCRVIRQVPPAGYGPAMHTALTQARGEIVVTIDCDDTYPVEAIPLLCTKIDAGFDLVSGSRLERRPKAMPLANFIANRLFALLGQIICGVPSTDLHTGMRAYRRKLLNEFRYEADGMALPVELFIGPFQEGFRCTEMFIEYKPRIGETTLRPLEGTIWTLRRLWRRRRKRLMFNTTKCSKD